MLRALLITTVLAALALLLTGAKFQAGGASVSINDLQFSPATLRIGAGTTVTWTNSDDRDHSVVADDGSFKSPNIRPGQSWRHTFASAGTFGYSCSYHPRQKGTVIVQ